MLKPTKRQKEVVSSLFQKFYMTDTTFRSQYDQNKLTMSVKELSEWAAGYILKMTPETERISDVHKVL